MPMPMPCSEGASAEKQLGFDPPAAAMRIPGAIMEPLTAGRQKAYQFLFLIRMSNPAGVQFYAIVSGIESLIESMSRRFPTR